MTNFVLLQDLLEYTRDGEWGKGEAGDGLVEMAVIRGTDFAAVRFNNFSSVPTRYIPASVAARKKLQPGDILLETAGGTKDQPTGRTVFLSDRHFSQKNVPLTCASFSRFLRVKADLVNPRYLFWYLQSIYESREMLPYHIQHTGVARFQYTDFASQWRVPIPSLSYQTAIADVLGSLDDKIELNRRMNETLEAMAQAIFRDWFVDFGPTRRKLEGATDPFTIIGGLVQDIERAQALADLFPAALGDDGLPKGWTNTTLGSAFNVQIGRTPPRKEHHHFVKNGAGVPWMSIRDLGEGGAFIYETAEGIAQDSMRLHRVPLIEEGTVVVSFKLTVGRVAITEQPMLSNEAIAQLGRLDAGQKPWFPYLWMKSFDYSRLGSTSSIATAVNSKSIKGIDYLVPTKNLRLQFDAIVEPLFERMRSASKETRTLTATRDILLPKLMSGEIRLKDAEKLIEVGE